MDVSRSDFEKLENRGQIIESNTTLSQVLTLKWVVILPDGINTI